jgi:hypothetical protein
MSEAVKELTEQQQKANLAMKISKLAKDLGAVEADGWNSHSKFNFISSNQMVALNRSHFESAGIAIFPEVDEYIDEHYKTAKGVAGIRSTVRMNFEIVDTETGYSLTKKFVGTDQDTGGKSQAQAITECKKRFYFNLFHVSSNEEVDPDSRTNETGAVEYITPKQVKEIKAMITKSTREDTEFTASLLTAYKLESLEEIRPSIMEQIKGNIQKYITADGE